MGTDAPLECSQGRQGQREPRPASDALAKEALKGSQRTRNHRVENKIVFRVEEQLVQVTPGRPEASSGSCNRPQGPGPVRCPCDNEPCGEHSDHKTPRRLRGSVRLLSLAQATGF
jgi:hypothetical protein